jgi:hypothetical protein
VQATSVGQVQVSGLNPAARYQFTFFASRMSYDDRITEYTIGSTKVTFDPVDNLTRTSVIADVQPAANGTVQFSVAADNGTGYGYLGVLDIAQTSTPPANVGNGTGLRRDYSSFSGPARRHRRQSFPQRNFSPPHRRKRRYQY